MKDREKMSPTNDFTFAHRDEGFDNHIDQSIRGYSTLHDDIVKMSRYFAENDTNVYDIGCSTGKTLAAMIDQNRSFAPDANYIGVEYAEGFREDMLARMREYEMDDLDLRHQDIRDVKIENANLVTSIFTLQFMPRKDRRATLEKIYKGLNPGGAFIFAEKTIAQNPRIQDMLTFQYYDFKRENFTEADIMEKEVTLRNMLKPNTWCELRSMLNIAGFGFDEIQPFWQNHLFVGAIAIKTW
jgi:tRNA (cmo5U34)-methyltransferase